ncbi:MAG: glycosyltransferase family 2 protein [Variovorax sp.]|jgi:glycosyltransferase involved in cell wall biosynthesis|nr:MAG: glycosyltransferase family 2 protein [Variovorax sp.]
MIGIVVPAHNEQAVIEEALNALQVAARHPALEGEQVELLVVLDSCTDSTEALARAQGVATLRVEARNVGHARATGAACMVKKGARWLAFTDADTIVSPEWLVRQLELDADVVCGSIGVDDWSAHGRHAGAIREHFARTYHDVDGHRHIHGANLGVSTLAYLRAGGFQSLACSEDVALVDALQASGARIAWSAAPRVRTSARADARARGGFGDTLLAVIAAGIAVTAASAVVAAVVSPHQVAD